MQHNELKMKKYNNEKMSGCTFGCTIIPQMLKIKTILNFFSFLGFLKNCNFVSDFGPQWYRRPQGAVSGRHFKNNETSVYIPILKYQTTKT